ncbi:MAG: hypothetical protein NZ694_01905, partial [Tepidimonas sp.]|nr:hypothetical protein [Tepidimonas sp.]
MPRKKTAPAAKPDAILPDALLEKLIPGPMDAAGAEAVFQKLKKAVNERALGAELGVHLASPESSRRHQPAAHMRHQSAQQLVDVVFDASLGRGQVFANVQHATLRRSRTA